MARAIGLLPAAVLLLLSPLPLFAHHKGFYQRAFGAIKNANIDEIKDLFAKSAWEGKEGMSAAELHKRLKDGKLTGDTGRDTAPSLREYSSLDEKRSKCLVTVRLQYPDKKVERIWLLAVDVDPRDGAWDWRIVRIVNDEKEAQGFFKHELPKD